MTLEELGACLRQIINDHSRLILPGMGVLYSQETAPQFIKNGNALTPPSRKLFFTAIVDSPASTITSATASVARATSNEELPSPKVYAPAPGSLADKKDAETHGSNEMNPIALVFAKENKMEYNQAYTELEELCRQAFNTLEEQAYVTIPDFGTIRYGTGLDFVFEPHPGLEYNIQNWGLDIICAKKIQTHPTPNDISGGQQNYSESSLKSKNEENHELKSISWMHDRQNKYCAIRKTALIISVAFILFVAAMFIFKDTFMPLWEKLLYTKEELQYLNSLK